MELNEETVGAYEHILSHPDEYGFTFLPLRDAFVQTDYVTGFHILFEQYCRYLQKPLPKMVFYIVFERLFGKTTGCDGQNNAGYHLTLKPDLAAPSE